MMQPLHKTEHGHSPDDIVISLIRLQKLIESKSSMEQLFVKFTQCESKFTQLASVLMQYNQQDEVYVDDCLALV